MSEWKTIDTFNGDDVIDDYIVWSEKLGVRVAWYDEEEDEWFDSTIPDQDSPKIARPTHWMPMPRPPSV